MSSDNPQNTSFSLSSFSPDTQSQDNSPEQFKKSTSSLDKELVRELMTTSPISWKGSND